MSGPPEAEIRPSARQPWPSDFVLPSRTPMKIRTQLVLACFLLSILPLSGIVLYSYRSPREALDAAYQRARLHAPHGRWTAAWLPFAPISKSGWPRFEPSRCRCPPPPPAATVTSPATS